MKGSLRAHGLVWAGTRTARHEQMSRFLADVLAIPVVFEVPGYVVHQLPDGAQVEVFTPDDPDHEHFTTGPVPGLLVDDVATANRALVAAGIELLGPLHEEQGHAWQHFRAPDGHVWEVTHRPVDRGGCSSRTGIHRCVRSATGCCSSVRGRWPDAPS